MRIRRRHTFRVNSVDVGHGGSLQKRFLRYEPRIRYWPRPANHRVCIFFLTHCFVSMYDGTRGFNISQIRGNRRFYLVLETVPDIVRSITTSAISFRLQTIVAYALRVLRNRFFFARATPLPTNRCSPTRPIFEKRTKRMQKLENK